MRLNFAIPFLNSVSHLPYNNDNYNNGAMGNGHH